MTIHVGFGRGVCANGEGIWMVPVVGYNRSASAECALSRAPRELLDALLRVGN